MIRDKKTASKKKVRIPFLAPIQLVSALIALEFLFSMKGLSPAFAVWRWILTMVVGFVPCPVLSCPVLSCRDVSCPALPCAVLVTLILVLCSALRSLSLSLCLTTTYNQWTSSRPSDLTDLFFFWNRRSCQHLVLFSIRTYPKSAYGVQRVRQCIYAVLDMWGDDPIFLPQRQRHGRQDPSHTRQKQEEPLPMSMRPHRAPYLSGRTQSDEWRDFLAYGTSHHVDIRCDSVKTWKEENEKCCFGFWVS